jgi:hypothetical protein
LGIEKVDDYSPQRKKGQSAKEGMK